MNKDQGIITQPVIFEMMQLNEHSSKNTQSFTKENNSFQFLKITKVKDLGLARLFNLINAHTMCNYFTKLVLND